ncbi:cyclin-D2-1 isoform X1 [Elaeis guineensis]|uniref:Cyclin-D2-1 isoform X1 n=1 Tax=Elaeis guineensis var. tenera TaxID=51953 RepID=A0A6I9QQN2_ELAGV|nr:cyclin-D2-1 isoform X1 [Elaeis guineensis]
MPLPLSDDSGSCCDLLCGEDAGALAYDSPGYSTEPEFPEDSDESIAGFIEGETDYSPRFDYSDRFRSRSLDPFARQESVAWILKVHEYYRFRPLTAYLAVNYVDRFLSSHRLPQSNGWALQLLSVACLSLAAKMEETLVPSLLDLQVEGTRFIFEPRTICRMELLVLTALNWRLRSVTPFTFIDFFAYKADPTGTHARYLVSRATHIILAMIHDIDFLNHCPSSIAAAAIICAADETQDLAFVNPGRAASWCIGLTEEAISSCCQLMNRVAIEHKQRKPPMILSQLRVTTPLSMGSGVSSSSSSPPNKRRKLDDNCL